MNQPPNDPFYNAPTENTNFPSLPRPGPGQAPGYPQQPSSPSYQPAQRPASQPGIQPQAYPPAQKPASWPGFSQQGYSQQGPAPSYPGQWSSSPGNYAPAQGPASYPGQPAQNFSPASSTSPSQRKAPSGVPPVTPKVTPPPPRQKKSKRGLTVLTSVIVVLAVIIAGAGTLFALHLRSTAQTKTPPKAQVTPTPSGSTPIATLPGSGTTGSLNQPLQAGDNWVVTVTHVTTTTASDFPPPAGHTYLEITLTLKNASATPQIVASLLQFTLADANGGRYNEAAAITKDTNIHQTPDGTVKAGQTLSAQLSYMVPQSQHTFVLSFAYNLIDGGSSSVTWQLSA